MKNRYLMDTHAYILAIADSELLPVKLLKQLEGGDLFLSFASVWEMVIKISLKKLFLPMPLSEVLLQSQKEIGFSFLPISVEHLLHVEHLAFHHRDPFDRLLVAQCLEEKIPIITKDRIFEAYDVKRIWNE